MWEGVYSSDRSEPQVQATPETQHFGDIRTRFRTVPQSYVDTLKGAYSLRRCAGSPVELSPVDTAALVQGSTWRPSQPYPLVPATQLFLGKAPPESSRCYPHTATSGAPGRCQAANRADDVHA